MNNTYKLFRLQCQDLLVLLEMEHNGILFNTEGALEHAKRLEGEQTALLTRFNALVGSSAVSITSGDDISSVLYGGIIVETIRIPVGFFKQGTTKEGQTRYKLQKEEHIFPRLVDPLPRTETKKSAKWRAEGKTEGESLWEVNEPVLKSLKAKGKAKEILTIILEYSKIEKLRGTYLAGYAKLIEEMNWEHNMLFPSLNQCVAITGRLSSSKPNGQNADKKTKAYMESRYAD